VSQAPTEEVLSTDADGNLIKTWRMK